MDSATINRDEETAQRHKLVSLQQEEIGQLREQLRLLRHKMFGPKSDRIAGHDQQLSMFEATLPAVAEPDEEPDAVRGYKRKEPGRKRLPDDLPQEHVYHDIPEAEKGCGCGARSLDEL